MNVLSYPSPSAEKRVNTIANRRRTFRKSDVATVNRIIEDVRKNGDAALIAYSTRFDAPEMTIADLRVTDAEMDAAHAAVKEDFIRALDRASRQIRDFHTRQRPNSWLTTDRPGTLLGQLVHPVEAAGIYVPGAKGGTTPLVSTVLMGAIPATIAGVERIVMVTPPRNDGSVNPHLLVAAEAVGVTDIYKVGSAWAVAALAYGTETVPRTDVIVGPGNIFVTIAKKIVSGTVGIDMVAGPSEILIIADRTANPAYIAADMLSQAEHDVLASAVLVTDHRPLADAVAKALEVQLPELPRQEIARESLDRYGVLLTVPDIATAVDMANRLAPEHLELQVAEPMDWIGRIRNAGAVFIGEYTPEPVGDYIAGPNHVLPTAGTARFSSALSVETFIKRTSVIRYSREAFQTDADDIIRLADTEGLGAHAAAIRIRQ